VGIAAAGVMDEEIRSSLYKEIEEKSFKQKYDKEKPPSRNQNWDRYEYYYLVHIGVLK